MFHSFDYLATYYKGSLDHYDAVLLVGEFEIPLIRKLEELRNLSAKELVPAGLPYMDELLKKAKQNSGELIRTEGKKDNGFNNPEEITVLLAPSWGEKGFLKSLGADFIERLAEKKFKLILRPHPQSLKVESKLIQNLESKLKKYNNLKWDFNPDGTDSLRTADILISDTSAVRLDFSMVYHKPFITIPYVFSQEAMQDFEITDIGFSWIEENIKEIGYTLQDGEIEKLDEVIMRVLKERTDKDILNFQNKNIFNIEHSGEVIAEYLIKNSI